MTVRGEIAEPHCETGVRSREDPMHTRAVRGGSEKRRTGLRASQEKGGNKGAGSLFKSHKRQDGMTSCYHTGVAA